MTKIKPWLYLAIIFAVGVVTGSALTIGLRPYLDRPPGDQQMRHRWMTHLTERLKLTADQQAKIQPILTDADAQLQSLHRDEVERSSQIFKSTHDQIAALLTPEQKGELKKMESDREKLFSTKMGPRKTHEPGAHEHPGGPMPPPDGPPPSTTPPDAPPPGH